MSHRHTAKIGILSNVSTNDRTFMFRYEFAVCSGIPLNQNGNAITRSCTYGKLFVFNRIYKQKFEIEGKKYRVILLLFRRVPKT